ncbi:MAG: hypothetical protein AVDCRST_MAG91-1146 [uncultured Sphingomonadaceae bacterium]|uniref:Uncharacterized protein n=1 Tax=uncultured Sphingomonadaceae bacterium TaxID=169976 RepID=A0A6J4SQH7_9SPHN|nr:MAG: hypothetical protein AVDCRST_MAG91-1146 [uncultured Sphingomonadaceae bacterium]
MEAEPVSPACAGTATQAAASPKIIERSMARSFHVIGMTER